jgi:hypothetical protein
MDSVAYLPSSSMPKTHDLGNHSHGYDHSKTALARSYQIDGKLILRWMETRKRFWNWMRIMIFNVAILLSRLGSLLICTHDLYILTKRRRNDPLLQIIRIR